MPDLPINLSPMVSSMDEERDESAEHRVTNSEPKTITINIIVNITVKQDPGLA